MEYNYDEFNVFDEAEIVPHDDYQMNMSGGGAGAQPEMSEGGGDYAEEEEFMGTIRRNEEKGFVMGKSPREEDK